MYGYPDGILGTFDKAVKKHGDGWILVTKRNLKKTAAPDNLFVVNEDCKKFSIEAAASIHTIVAKVLYFSKVKKAGHKSEYCIPDHEGVWCTPTWGKK